MSDEQAPSSGGFHPPYGSPQQDTRRFDEPTEPYSPSFSYPSGGYAAPPPHLPPPVPPSWQPSSSGPVSRPPAGRRRAGIAAAVAGVLVLCLGAGALGAVIEHSDDHSSGSAPVAAASSAGTTLGAPAQGVATGGNSSTPKSYAQIAAAVLPVVVQINVVVANGGDTGSGVVIRSDGYILTNNHVVAAAAGTTSRLTVTFNDGSTEPAKIVGTDLSSDLAVIKVGKTGLQTASLGDSSTVKVGDAVLAVGSPLGLSGTVTSGIVSALNRPVDTTADQQQQQQQQQNPFLNPFGSGGSGGSGGTTTTTPTVFGAIQTDAAINPGNSGGALVDAAGNVIGINSAIASLGSSGGSQSGSIGVGFAIPINLAKNVAQQLISTGKATHAQIGVSVADDVNQSTGVTTVVVNSVQPGSPGAKAGLQKGDVITKIDNTVVTDSDTLIATIRSHRPGDTITLTVSRSGASKTLQVTLGSA